MAVLLYYWCSRGFIYDLTNITSTLWKFFDFLFICVDLYLSTTSLLVQYLHQYQSYEYVGSPQNRAFQSLGWNESLCQKPYIDFSTIPFDYKEQAGKDFLQTFHNVNWRCSATGVLHPIFLYCTQKLYYVISHLC